MTIRVDRTVGGKWEVVSPGGGERVVCPTLADAVRAGYKRVADAPECELVVRDAYHRVVRRERHSACAAKR
jgi:hypothetical protein